MRRRLFTILSALSLLLCVATVVLWARSYWIYDSMNQMLERSVVGHYCLSSAGAIGFRRLDFLEPVEPYSDVRWQYHSGSNAQPYQFPVSRKFLGIGWDNNVELSPNVRRSVQRRLLTLPHWLLAILFAALPARWLRSFIRSRRPKPGHCLRCGYDLRATPDRCPECGTVSATAQTISN